MKKGDAYKMQKVQEGFVAFFAQFGELDETSRVALEEILGNIHGKRKKETLPVLSEEGQDGDQSN